MATPFGAKHQDFEQVIADIRAQLRALTSASLYRKQLSVTQGDFVVRGGGSVIVEDGGGVTINDGGTLRTEYTNGQEAVRIGPIVPSSFYDHGFLMFDEAGTAKVWFAELLDGRFTCKVSGDQVEVISGGDAYLTANDTLHISGSTVDATATADFRIGHNTTGSAANCRIETSGLIQRVSSSLRYKADVADAVVSPAEVLQLQGRTWVDKDNEGDPDAPRHIGFIAEELHDAGLGQFVEYDELGRPDAIQYDRLSVGLLAVAKSQQAQLDALAARLDALENPA